MAKRHGMSRRASKHHFTKHAKHLHIRNTPHQNRMIMRGGIRL